MPQDSQHSERYSHTLWRHTRHLRRLSGVGRNRPPPSIGSPTLIWHLGIWRKHNHAKGRSDAHQSLPHIDQYEHYNARFFEETSDFLSRLQERGLCTTDSVQRIRLERIPIEGTANEIEDAQATPRRFQIFTPQSASFTLWWRDKAKDGSLNSRITPRDDDVAHALRVFVQFQSFQDHITITFYIDGAKRFGGKQIHKPEEGDLGERRGLFSRHLDNIRCSCHDEIVSGAIDLPSSPPRENPQVPATDLEAASTYLLEGIWNEFQEAFGFAVHSREVPNRGLFLDEGVIFVNQRGLMMSIRGLDTEEDERRKQEIDALAGRNHIAVQHEPTTDQAPPWRPLERGASATLGPVDVFDQKCGEPEVVLKSLWPFLCEMTQAAGRKDWVGCGILDWRALLMSTLGSKEQPPSSDVTGNGIAAHLRTVAPERFLIVTKGEPHRKQIGRFVERLLALETTRAIAFKNLGAIQNASLHLRALTMDLDDILEQWSKDRQALQREHLNEAALGAPAAPQAARWWHRWRRRESDVLPTPPANLITAEERFYDKLSKLNAKYETMLINIAASLEIMGPGGSGHLAHSIDESSYFIDEFDRLVPTLEIGNIAGWINYAQFADRGMSPTFNMIKNTGRRLAEAQDRLKSLTDVVQVSALIVQSDATRRNTATLRQIAHNLQLLNRPWLSVRSLLGSFLFSFFVLALFAILNYKNLQPLLGRLLDWLNT